MQLVARAFAHGADVMDPLSYFSFQSVLQCRPVCGMMHIKESLLLIGKTSPCVCSGFALSRYISGPLPYYV